MENEFASKPAASGSEVRPVHAEMVRDGEVLASTLQAARTAQHAWAKLAASERARMLRPLAQRVLRRADEIADLIHLEMGKPVVEALLGEVLPSADLVAYWCDAGPELLDVEDVELDLLTFAGKSASISREPRGVVALITPWNFPVALPLRTIVPALLAGNAVVMKPSEVSPKCGTLLASLLEGCVPTGLFSVLAGAGTVGAALVAADVDAVVFTGSVATGRKVAIACAERFIPCSLELGGKDAAIVLADADLVRTARGVVWGALANAGQNCAAIERVYVEKSIAEAFQKQLLAEVAALLPGDVAALATQAQFDRVHAHVEDARRLGNKVLVGGVSGPSAGGPSASGPSASGPSASGPSASGPSASGPSVSGPSASGPSASGPSASGEELAANAIEARRYPPTIVEMTDPNSLLLTEETFGPVIALMTVNDADDAVRQANSGRFGLTASVWSKSRTKALAVAARLRVGVVTVNNHSFTGAIAKLPWTGVAQTGFGVTNSSHALHFLTRPRALVFDRGLSSREVWWFPYTPVLTKLARAFIAVRGGPGLFGRIRAAVSLLILLPKRGAGG